jgi:hypothetical protein
MSLKLPNFFVAKGYLDDIQNYSLSSFDMPIARIALKSDIDAFIVNGLISFSSAINSLNKNNYSWSFIQCYYSLFYFARAFIGLNDFAIVYKDSKPYGIKIQPSSGFIKLKGNSHDVVLSQFKKHFGSDILLANNIDSLSPIDWFNKNRNFINYTLNPQTDPIPPIDLFDYKNELRKWLVTYANDSVHTYTFDSKHCYLAYPFQVFLRIYNFYSENENTVEFIDEERLDYLKRNFSDDKGPMTSMIAKIKDLCA